MQIQAGPISMARARKRRLHSQPACALCPERGCPRQTLAACCLDCRPSQAKRENNVATMEAVLAAPYLQGPRSAQHEPRQRTLLGLLPQHL